jgi:hypothetical protein
MPPRSRIAGVCACLCTAAALAAACSAPRPDRIETRAVDFQAGQSLTLELPARRATIFAPTELRTAVKCRATGPGGTAERELTLLRARDIDNPPTERNGRQWSQVGAITEGPGPAQLTCSGPAGTPLFADIWLNAPK